MTSNQENRPSDRELLLGALAFQNDIADVSQLEQAKEQSMRDTDRSFTDALKAIASLDSKSIATLEQLADLKVSRADGNTHETLMKTVGSAPRVKNALFNFGPLDESQDGISQENGATVAAEELPTSDRYELGKVHGRGGLGQVWRAKDRYLAREVALKEILPSAAQITEVNDRFLREAKITGQLEHPGIVPVYDIGRLSDEEQPFYVMRFVDGETLDDRIKQYHEFPKGSEKATLLLRDLLGAFVGICNAIAFAHDKNVLHRDLKPQNVILGNFGEVSVLDWGLARLIDSDEENIGEGVGVADLDQIEKTAAGTVMGTPAYMAPEQAQGKLDELTTKTDVYALGTILYQILTGRPPFNERKYDSLIQRIIEQAPASPRQLNSAVAAPLSAICLKALEKKPSDRYETATEFANDINRYLADEKVHAYSESIGEQVSRWMRHHRTLVTSVAAAMVVAIAGLSIASVLLNAARNRESLAKQRIASQKSAIERANSQLESTNQQLETSNEQLGQANKKLVDANQKVERSLKDARDAIDNWYTLVAENKELKNSPRSSAFRKQLLNKAGDYYEKFLKELPDNESLKLSAAESNVRLAIIKLELEPGLAAVPYFEKAEKAYVSLLEKDPDNRDLNIALAGVLNDKSAAYNQVDQTKKSEECLSGVEKIYAKLVADSPDDKLLQRKMATVVANRGEIYLKLNKARDSINCFDKAMKIYQKLADEDFESARTLREMGQCRYRRGVAYLRLQNLKAGLEDFKQAKSIREELLELDPSDPKFRKDLLNMSFDYGNLMMQLNQFKNAESTFVKAVELAEGLSADFPDVPTHYWALATAYGNLARVQSILKKLDASLESFKKAIQVTEELVKQHPEVPSYQAQNANIAINYGIALAHLAKTEPAIKQFEYAANIYDRLVKNHPEIQAYASNLLNTRSNIVAMYFKDNKLKKSYDMGTIVIEDCKKFIQRWPDTPDFRETLGGLYSSRASAGSQIKDKSEGAADFKEAMNIRQKLATEYPDNMGYLKDLAESYNNYGIFLTYVRDTEEARKFLEKAVATRQQIANAQPTNVGAATDVAVSTFALGQAYMHDDYQKAEQIFGDAIKKLVQCVQKSPRFNRAQKYLMLTGQSRAWVRMFQAKDKKALTDLEQLLHIKTPRIKHETRASVAHLYARMGDFKKSKEFLNESRLALIETSQAQLDYAAAHAMQRSKILADDSLEESEKNKLAEEHLNRCIAGLKAAIKKTDITSRASLKTIAEEKVFQSVAETSAFKDLLMEQK